MGKLMCDIGACESKKDSIKLLVEEYNLILQSLISLENDSTIYWKTESQKVYFNKFIERKSDLEKLSQYYSQMCSFLDSTFNSYKSIESSYS